MAEEPEDSEDDFDMSEISVEDSINSSMRDLTENEYNGYLAIPSIRRLFREEGDDEDEEEEEEETPVPSIEYITQKLVQQGVTMEQLVKVLLVDHAQYDAIEEECLTESDRIFDVFQAIITDFTPAVPEEPKTDIDEIVSAYMLRSSYN
jgi:hypothetical protein